MNLPLAGVRIISFEQFGAAPYATMFLADFGAEVIKVEAGGGDYARRTGPQTLGADDSLYFQCFNLNKKSAEMDLREPADRALFEELVRGSHAVINNLRGSLPARLGLDFASLKSLNPAIVCGHISAYGRHGSRADWPGYDFLMQAEAGFMSLTGDPGAPPTRVGLSMIDYMTGMMLAFGVVSALRRAEHSGQGADVDASLFDVAIHQLAYQGTWYLNDGIETARVARSAHPSSVPVQLYRTADGWIYIACMNQKFWELLCPLIGDGGLVDDPRFATLEERLENRDVLTELLDGLLGTRTTAQWVERLGGQVPVAPVYGLGEALKSRFLLEEADMIATVEHTARGPIRVFANPIRLDGNRLPQRAAPALGEHSAELRAAHRVSSPDGRRASGG